MKQVREQLDSFGYSRPGPGEVGVRIDCNDASASWRLDSTCCIDGLCEPKPAWGNDDDL
jgi:hypothetical protein